MIIEIILLTMLGLFLSQLRMIQRRRTLPPGPVPWPVLGNLPLLDRSSPQKTCQKLAKIYGPVFTFWMGRVPWVMVTDYEIMKDAFTKHGDQLTGRPTIFTADHVRKGKFGLAQAVGERWKEQKRFSLQTLRSFGLGRNIMEERILSEAKNLATSLADDMGSKGRVALDIAMPLKLCVTNVMASILLGFTFDKGDKTFELLDKTLHENFKLVATPQIFLLNSFPWLRHLPFFGHFGMDEFNRQDKIISDFMLEHIKKHEKELETNGKDKQESTDFIDAYLKEMRRRKREGEDMGYFSEWQLLRTVYDLMTAGMDTTMTTLRWAILAMVKYPRVQQKVIEEIDSVLGREKAPSMADRMSLPYALATINEAQRWGNILPINVFHSDENPVKIGSYTIPKNVAVAAQISVLAIDEKVFPEPEVFRPERFLGEDGKTFQNVEQFAPFSLGKRQCLGDGMARAELFLIFVHLMQRFKFLVPDGAEEPSAVPDVGLTFAPHPFECLVVLR